MRIKLEFIFLKRTGFLISEINFCSILTGETSLTPTAVRLETTDEDIDIVPLETESTENGIDIVCLESKTSDIYIDTVRLKTKAITIVIL